MGLRFRKSINLGGFRINLSKSGIGYSFGIKGLRYTKKANGGNRITTSLPGTGLSYVHEGSNKAAKTTQKKSETPSQNENEVTSINSEVIESSPNEFISTMNEATRKNRVYKILRIVSIIGIAVGIAIAASCLTNAMPLYSIPCLILAAVCGVICFLIPKATIGLEINFSDEKLKSAYEDVLKGMDKLKSSDELWEISTLESVDDWKNNAGAHKVVERKNAKISSNNISFIESELALQCITAQGMNMVFLPNFLAVCQNNLWKSIEYSQVKIGYFENVFIETDAVPNDTEILGYTYLHPNKSGGPDARYSNNPQIPRCAYARILLASENGLVLLLMGSSREKAKTFVDNVNKYIELFTS